MLIGRNYPDKSWFDAMVGERTVLVLEDEPLIRCATAEILCDAGYNVLEAQTGVEALARLNEYAVDVMVADINLPGKLTGLEVGMLALLALPRLKLVVTSGGNAPDGSQMPPNSVFLAKPYRPHQIRAAVEGSCYPMIAPASAMTCGVMPNSVTSTCVSTIAPPPTQVAACTEPRVPISCRATRPSARS